MPEILLTHRQPTASNAKHTPFKKEKKIKTARASAAEDNYLLRFFSRKSKKYRKIDMNFVIETA